MSKSRQAVCARRTPRKQNAGAVSWCYVDVVTFIIEVEREEDGRWLAEVPALSGVMCYGEAYDEVVANVQALALRMIAERVEHGEAPAEFVNVTFKAR